ncbi:MAG: phosphatidylglycerol lysyltransferase domain-containing protein [Planctomycetes bacterium]|nr:phosphatidylglycerol lysyltransferase domain-containing protein [Planctomycetota bacterium]
MIEEYPEFSPLSLEQRPVLHPRFERLAEGMSELTFANIYLFRATHDYQISRAGENVFVIAGRDAEPFFILPFELPPEEILNPLFDRYRTMKAVSKSQAQQLAQRGCRVWEDRDNFDYLYAREKLAALSGRQLHRKKNLVNLFLRNNQCTAKPLLAEHAGDALAILERWKAQQEQPGDYAAAREAIASMETLQLCGGIFHVEGEAVAYVLGEEVAQGRMFVIHFEKAILKKEYTGIYQYVNQAFVAALPQKYELINREQDLGEPGLRRAKESYRPVGYVKKYRAARQ